MKRQNRSHRTERIRCATEAFLGLPYLVRLNIALDLSLIEDSKAISRDPQYWRRIVVAHSKYSLIGLMRLEQEIKNYADLIAPLKTDFSTTCT